MAEPSSINEGNGKCKDKHLKIAQKLVSENLTLAKIDSELEWDGLLPGASSLARQESLERAVSGTLADVLDILDPDSDEDASTADALSSDAAMTAAWPKAPQAGGAWLGQQNSPFSGFIPSAPIAKQSSASATVSVESINGFLLDDAFGGGLDLFVEAEKEDKDYASADHFLLQEFANFGGELINYAASTKSKKKKPLKKLKSVAKTSKGEE